MKAYFIVRNIETDHIEYNGYSKFKAERIFKELSSKGFNSEKIELLGQVTKNVEIFAGN